METYSELGFVSKNHAAKYSSLSLRTIDNRIACGQLPAFRVGRRVLIRKRDLDAMIEGNPVGADVNAIVEETMRDLGAGE